MSGLFAPIEATPLKAPRSGLLFSVPAAANADFEWTEGYSWSPEGVGKAETSGLVCGVVVDARETHDRTPPREHVPFLLWTDETCSTTGLRSRDWQGRARRSLEAEQSYLLAAELWDGAAGGPLGNDYLTNVVTAQILTAGPVPILVGFQYVDGAVTRRLRNRQGLVHMRPEIIVSLHKDYAIEHVGDQYLTPNGNIVVADAGYSGNGPGAAADGSSQWIFGTDMLGTRLGPIDVYPASMDPADLAPHVIRGTNDLTVWAQRPAAYQWDVAAHFAAEVSQGALV